MKGYITKGIGGFYYVKTPEGIVECKPRGIFRKQKITPVAGDEVTLETENGAAVIAEIAPRKNVFVRPPMANLDVLFLVASTTQPTPSTLVLDKLSAIAVDKGVQPVINCFPAASIWTPTGWKPGSRTVPPLPSTASPLRMNTATPRHGGRNWTGCCTISRWSMPSLCWVVRLSIISHLAVTMAY